MRVLHYSHDDYGVDNLQQTLAVAERLALEFPEATQLLVTESPQPYGVKLPGKSDYIKLPGRAQSSGTGNHRPSLSLPYPVIKSLRKTFIFDAIRCFKADVVLVQTPWEVQKEFFSGLNDLHQRPIKAKVVLGNGGIEKAVMMIQAALVSKVLDPPFSLSKVGHHREEDPPPVGTSFSNCSHHPSYTGMSYTL